jgi:sugar lactone lactonase YvrE
VPPSVGQSALKAFDLRSGALKASYPLPGPKAACNDVAIAPDRTLYVTDTSQGRILTLRRSEKALALYSDDPALRGADGIAFAGDGTLYINSVSTNALLRVDRKPDGSFAGATKLALSQPIAGPDGLRPIGRNRFLQAEGNASKVTIVTITGDQAEIRDLATGIPSTAGVAPARGRVYAVEGKITYLFDPKLKGHDPGPFHARAVPLPAGAR